MSVSLLTNSAATMATSNLSSVSVDLQKSLNRLSSGSKIVAPSDDAGGLAVSMKMNAAIKRQAAASNNISNAISYLQTQDGALESASQILSRIGELKTLSQDVTKNVTDKANYETEFQALREQLRGLSEETFNGISLFGATDHSVRTTADGTSAVALTGVDLLGANSAPFAAISEDFSNLDSFTDASLGTASAGVGSGRLTMDTGSNDVAQVNSNQSVSGAWELSFTFDKSDVVNDDLTVLLGGSEVFSYDATNAASHSVRIVFDGANTAEVYLDGAGSPTETNVVGSSSGNVSLRLTSTVAGASANIDDFALTSSVTSNDVGAVSSLTSLSSLAVSTVSDAIEEVATFRAQNGAQQSRLQYARDQLSVNQANLEAANSRITDVDVAVESTQLARLNILQQAGASMLSQANQSQQIALRLIG